MMKKSFPLTGIPLEDIKKQLKVPNDYISEDSVFLGYPQSMPHPLGVEIFTEYLSYNENHVGVFTNTDKVQNISRQLEKELIEMMGQLYGDINIDGYVTSGGTEGNIMGVWIARNYFEGNICLFKTELTHQSIEKACNIMKILDVSDIPYTENYQMDIDCLKESIIKKIDSGVLNFIVVCTAGYTMTGTKDSVVDIDHMLQTLSEKYKANFYIHVDAAIGGLVFPFISNEEFAFACKYVYSLSVDPHKMGYIPFSAGIFMCRQGMQKYIEIPIKYAKKVMDKTLINSRNAAAAVACWGVFNYLGKSGFSAKLHQLILVKEYLIKKLEKSNLAEIISDPGTNMLCVHFLNRNGGCLPEIIEKKYVLDGFYLFYKCQKIMCYKIYIMPHVTQGALDHFVNDLKIAFKGEIDEYE